MPSAAIVSIDWRSGASGAARSGLCTSRTRTTTRTSTAYEDEDEDDDENMLDVEPGNGVLIPRCPAPARHRDTRTRETRFVEGHRSSSARCVREVDHVRDDAHDHDDDCEYEVDTLKG